MSTTTLESMTPAEAAFFTASVERLRQLRRTCGIPDTVTLVEAVAWHMISAEELAQARWGDLAPPSS
jgi:hypothetical protein